MLSSCTSIILSEIGDNTFILTAILSLTHPPLAVFIGSYCAAIIMSTISFQLGYWISMIISLFLINIIGTVVFGYYAYKLLKKFVQKKKQDKLSTKKAEQQIQNINEKLYKGNLYLKNIKIIYLVFLCNVFGELGDRSQISTFLLSTQQEYQILIGVLLGHLICVLISVLGGKLAANKLKKEYTYLLSGILFLFYTINGISSIVSSYQ